MRVETLPHALVIGAGVAGLRAALSLSDLGISVHIVEKDAKAGGQVARWGTLFPNDKVGSDLIASLLAEVDRRENIVLHLSTELVEKEGRVGDFTVKLRTVTLSPPKVAALSLQIHLNILKRRRILYRYAIICGYKDSWLWKRHRPARSICC